MQYLIDFADWLKEAFTTIWDFITGFVEDLLMLFEYLGIAAESCYEIIESLPDFLKMFATITVVVSLLFMILGRDGGGSE